MNRVLFFGYRDRERMALKNALAHAITVCFINLEQHVFLEQYLQYFFVVEPTTVFKQIFVEYGTLLKI